MTHQHHWAVRGCSQLVFHMLCCSQSPSSKARPAIRPALIKQNESLASTIAHIKFFTNVYFGSFTGISLNHIKWISLICHCLLWPKTHDPLAGFGYDQRHVAKPVGGLDSRKAWLTKFLSGLEICQVWREQWKGREQAESLRGKKAISGLACQVFSLMI